jgi:hypothetical protein
MSETFFCFCFGHTTPPTHKEAGGERAKIAFLQTTNNKSDNERPSSTKYYGQMV